MSPVRPELMSITSRAFEGMTRVLFKPFDIKKWFLLGFTAWLAQLIEGGGANVSFNYNIGGGGSSDGSGGMGLPGDEVGRLFEVVSQWVQDHIGMVITIASILLMTMVAVYITLVWVRSRGKFMFLDNVVHNRCLVKAPWHEFREQGNSLCKWTLLFVAILLGVLLAIVGSAGWYVYEVVKSQAWTTGAILVMVAIALVLFFLILLSAVISMVLEHFIVPIMYRDKVTATEAWRKFLPVLRVWFWRFVLYVLWMFVLGFGVAAVTVMVGMLTCCIGFLVMALPYLGAVLLLPVSVFFRLIGVDYLRQFGEEFDVYSAYVPALPEE